MTYDGLGGFYVNCVSYYNYEEALCSSHAVWHHHSVKYNQFDRWYRIGSRTHSFQLGEASLISCSAVCH